ncbi:MAG: hypothetical protein H0T65_24295, partial [Deltaproteobacteria bacterium]|nr:hypothetical protein [Deltaproteobacteria bacterium]
MRLPVLFLVLAACGTSGGGDDTSGDDGPPVPKCDVTHFEATARDFALPVVGAEATRVPFSQMADNESIIGMLDANRYSVIAYATMDIDGDNRPDLVMSERNNMATVGTSRWL